MLIISLILMAVGVAADQVVKYLVVENLKPLGSYTVIPGFLDLTYAENTGAAFSILEGHTWILSVVVSVCIILVLGATIFYQNHTFFSRAAAILIVAGGVGNLIDRFVLGYVVDYISVSFFPPIFNLADCFVVVGVILFLIHMLFMSRADIGREHIIRTRR